MPLPFLVVVLCLCSSWTAADDPFSSDAVTTAAAIEASGIIGKQADVLETSSSRLESDSVTSGFSAGPAASSNVAFDLGGTLTTVEGTTAVVSPRETTDTIEFRVLVGLSCKWVDGNGIEKQSRVCPAESTCDLGPITTVKKSGLDQRLYFCTGEQQLLVSIACRLEDRERVVVLPRCTTGSRCSIGPLALSYRGRQVRGYFCDAQILPPSSSWTEREAADTWTASDGINQLDRHREQKPRHSGNLPPFNGGKSENDDGNDKNWMQDAGTDHGDDHGEDEIKDGTRHEGGASDDDDDDHHVHHGPRDKEDERLKNIDVAQQETTDETPTAETFDRNRFPGTTA